MAKRKAKAKRTPARRPTIKDVARRTAKAIVREGKKIADRTARDLKRVRRPKAPPQETAPRCDFVDEMEAEATFPEIDPATLAPSRKPKWGELLEGVKYFPLHEHQAAVLRSTARFTAAIAGTGGGKTAVGPVWVMQQIQRVLAERDVSEEPILGMVVAPTYKILQRATAPHLVNAFKGTDLEGEYVPTASQYRLPNGLGVIWVLSADNPGGLEGGQFDFVWCDEGGQLKYDAWVAVQGRTGLKQAPVLITTTPYGQNWLFHNFYRPWEKGDADYYVRQWSSYHNPAYPKAEYERARGALAPQRFAMRYDGSFVKRAGLVYPDIDSCIVDPWPTVPEGQLYGGLDWGWNDPFAGLAAVKLFDEKTQRDVLYVFYERYKRNVGLAAHSQALPPGPKWFADPSRPDSINELRKGGHRVVGAYNDILVGVDAVNARIYSGRLLISKDCRALLAEAKDYAYPEKDDESHGEKPIGGFDHALDALRYLVAGADRLRVVKSTADRRRGERGGDAA